MFRLGDWAPVPFEAVNPLDDSPFVISPRDRWWEEAACNGELAGIWSLSRAKANQEAREMATVGAEYANRSACQTEMILQILRLLTECSLSNC